MESPRSSRPKRQKLENVNKFAALQQIRKGTKNKYQVDELENVYETVDEREYTKKVLERQDDDWIVDDNGGGYVEDGRDIFDDDLDTQSLQMSAKSKGKNKNKAESKSKSSLRSFFANASVKKTTETVKIEDDDILAEILSNIDSSNDTKILTPSSKNDKKAAKEYVKNLQILSEKRSKKEQNKIVEVKNEKVIEDEVIECTPQRKINPFSEKQIQDKKVNSTITKDDDIEKKHMQDEAQTQENKSEDPKVQNEEFDPSEFEMDDDINLEMLKNDDFEELLEDPKIEDTDTAMEVDFKLDEITDVDNSMMVTEGDEKYLRFFWYDACEDKYSKTGTVFMFGKIYNDKTNSFESCCVTIRNIEKRVFILPRTNRFDLKTKQLTDKPISMMDVYTEVNKKYATSDKFRTRKVVKKYCFTIENVPQESEYLEVRYPATGKEIFNPQEQAETFEYVFGTNVGPLERLILENKLRGPCWLNLQNCQPESNPISYCQSEFRLENMLDLKVATGMLPPAPPLTVFVISVTTCYNPKKNLNEIILITMMLQPKYFHQRPPVKPYTTKKIALITRPSNTSWPLGFSNKSKEYDILKCDCERELLCCFIAQLTKYNPDLIVGHDLIAHQLELLIRRCEQLKIPTWSKLGRLKRSIIPHRIKDFQMDVMPGRLVCDIRVSAEEIIRSRSYDLGTLCNMVLKIEEDERESSDREDIREMYDSPISINNLITMNFQDANYIIEIMHTLHVVPLAFELTRLSGYILSKTLIGHRSERIEYLLLHAFNEHNYILPDKMKYNQHNIGDDEADETDAKGKRKPGYLGGLVLEPKVGFYDTFILLMDFNSLYPSVIQEYNVCFTTRIALVEETAKDAFAILPKEIWNLVQSRQSVKKAMASNKNPQMNLTLNVRQKALKLTANSIYGCLGFKSSRFYCKDLAAFVTEKGRNILVNTKAAVEKLRFDVIYGDTDSIMINTGLVDYEQVMRMGVQIRSNINNNYSHIKLGIDGIFRFLLLLKKKKYAALTISKNPDKSFVYEQEIKGLDIVRRDWSQIAAETGKFILNNILKEQSHSDRIDNIHEHLRKIREDLICDKVPHSLLAITKKLTKDPTMYANKNSLPHVLVALRLNSKGSGRKLKQGDTVSYVICDDGTQTPPMQRAYHLNELKTSEKLKVDVNYYLAQQIHPVVARLCEPITDISGYTIAQSLGIDFKQNVVKTINAHEDTAVTLYCDPSQFNGVDPFSFICSDCGHKNEIMHPIKKIGDQTLPSLYKCSNTECTSRPVQYADVIVNCLIIAVRKYLKKYHSMFYTCEDPSCSKIVTVQPRETEGDMMQCDCGRGNLVVVYSVVQLCMQLKYFKFLFNLESYSGKLVIDEDLQQLYTYLYKIIQGHLLSNNYYIFNIADLFQVLPVFESRLTLIDEEQY